MNGWLVFCFFFFGGGVWLRTELACISGPYCMTNVSENIRFTLVRQGAPTREGSWKSSEGQRDSCFQRHQWHRLPRAHVHRVEKWADSPDPINRISLFLFCQARVVTYVFIPCVCNVIPPHSLMNEHWPKATYAEYIYIYIHIYFLNA